MFFFWGHGKHIKACGKAFMDICLSGMENGEGDVGCYCTSQEFLDGQKQHQTTVFTDYYLYLLKGLALNVYNRKIDLCWFMSLRWSYILQTSFVPHVT